MELDDNTVEIVGEVKEKPVFNHRVLGEDFYSFILLVKRTSGAEDELPILISNKLFEVERINKGMRLWITGQLRSYNLHTSETTQVVISVLVDDIDETGEKCLNRVNLSGYICKKPIYRETPLGRRIANVILAINRQNGKTSYIPLIIWGRDAICASKYEVGTYLEIEGRLQSRTYQKMVKIKTAYEVSVISLRKNDEILQPSLLADSR